jgi:RNA polymerase-binding transcription factor DksA
VNVETGDQADLRVLDRAEGELEDVERALGRLDEGTYATCEACGGMIGEDRLAASPLTRRCAGHAQVSAPGSSAGI